LIVPPEKSSGGTIIPLRVGLDPSVRPELRKSLPDCRDFLFGGNYWLTIAA
jgi:hypothetical protein